MPDPTPRVYARHLLPFGYGYPLWTPEPGNQLVCRHREGLRIGDVGVVVPENGSFDVFFNICYPHDHALNRVNGVPESFMHINLDEQDIAIFAHAENPGSVISTSSVRMLRTVEPSNRAGQTYEFSLSSSEGALLILPEGAESHTLLKRKVFQDAASQNGISWYNFAEQKLGRIISPDSLYLITGCHKTHSWSVAALHETSFHSGPSELPAQFKTGQASRGNIAAGYAWETTRALQWRAGPLGDWPDVPNQAVFITGFKIAIRDGILGRKRVQVEVDAPPTRPTARKVFSSIGGHSKVGRIFKSLGFKGDRGRGARQHAEAQSTGEPEARLASNASGSDKRVTVTHTPEAPQSSHPSDIINRYMLSKEPPAVVAVAHDSQWSVLIERGVLKPEDLRHDDRLVSKIFENHQSVVQDGVVCLQSVCDLSLRLTDVGDAVREAWENNKLDVAEETLSRYIIRRTNSNHSAFAHRALIRARLERWDAALRDAETSIDIQPSVAARVAKGIALFGQQHYPSASQVFNVAACECDASDKILVSLVKSIVLFQVGYYAESMASASDLLEHSPAPVRFACSAVQAEMHVRFASLATKDENYERALQLLTHAQSLGPFHAVPELGIISLICGWEFDNLPFNIHRQRCEGLYIAGHVDKAAESLNAIVYDLGEDVMARKENSNWIATFTQQCLKSLESIGDSALALQDYTVAIKHYSEVLNMNPTICDGILVKRSSAHAAIGAWDDALNDAEEAISLNPLSPWGHERKLAALKGLERPDEAIQAFDEMLSTLDHFIDPHMGFMATQTMNPNLPGHQNYPPHNSDHRSIIETIISATENNDFQHIGDMLRMLRAERDQIVRERQGISSASQPGRLEPLMPRSSKGLPSQPTMSQDIRSQLTSTTSEVLDICPRFRLLIIGNSGVGKSTLIQKVFGVKDVNVSDSSRGKADINQEFVAAENNFFVVHDSLGLEAGESTNFDKIKQFIGERRQMVDLKDRLHAVWVCITVPYCSGRLLEVGIENFLRDKESILGDIPVVVVLTKLDLLYVLLIQKLQAEGIKFTSMEEAKKITEPHLSAFLRDHCFKYFQQADGLNVPHVAVSTRAGFGLEPTISELVKTTTFQIEQYIKSNPSFMPMSKLLGLEPNVPLLIAGMAQRASIETNVRLTIEVGKNKYWKNLSASLVFSGERVTDCLLVVLEDVIRVWNFDDPEMALRDEKFQEALLNPPDLRVQEIRDLNATLSTVMPLVTGLAPLFHSFVGSSVGLPTAQAAIPILATLAHEIYQSTQNIVKRFMSFIIDLTYVMKILFILAPHGSITPRDIAVAMNVYESSTYRRRIHLEIRGFDTLWVTVPGLGGRDTVLEKMEELIRRYDITDQDVLSVRDQIRARPNASPSS